MQLIAQATGGVEPATFVVVSGASFQTGEVSVMCPRFVGPGHD